MFTWIKYWWQQFILVSIILLLTIQPSFAINVSDVPLPPVDSYIVDLADLLDTDTEVEIDRAIITLEQKKHKAIYLVTIPEVPESKAKAKFKLVPPISSSRRFLESLLLYWNLEQLNQGNAMLMLVSKADQSIEIRSGSNLKYIIRDRFIQGVIDKIIIPKFEDLDFSKGILMGIKVFVSQVDNSSKILSELDISISENWWENYKKTVQCDMQIQKNVHNWTNHRKNRCLNFEVKYYGGSGKW